MSLRQRVLGWPDEHVDLKRTDLLTRAPTAAPRCLDYALSLVHGEPQDVRVLDIGCGRGDTVALLRARGYDAYGVEIRKGYLDNGRPYFENDGPDRLRLIEDGYPFADETFDLVVSDQVLEHVEDLPEFAAESARVLRPGGFGVHNFPARWRPVEPHMFTPLAHWLPKGQPRRRALAACVALGLADPGFAPAGTREERVRRMADYSERETFYRPLRQLTAEFLAAGLEVEVHQGVAAKLRAMLPESARAAAPVLAVPWRHLQAATITVRKPG